MKKGEVLITIYIILCIIGFIFIGYLITIPIHSQEWTDIKPTEKLVKADGNKSKYLIFTDNEVFENTDEFILGKFNSSDLYRDLEIGKDYHCLVTGYRIPFLSWYRNIIKCERR